MSDINDIEKSFLEAKEFETASIKVIADLQRKLKTLEDENKHLKEMLTANVPILDVVTTDLTLGISNEQLVCETQISNLKNYAVFRDLTLEETKKFDMFVSILEKIKRKNDSTDITVKKMSDDDLLKLVHNNG